jgi:WD40 repeat protein
VWTLAFSHNGKWLATGDNSGKLMVWSAESFQYLRTLDDSARAIWSVAFSADSKWLATANFNGTLTLWDTVTWQSARTLTPKAPPRTKLQDPCPQLHFRRMENDAPQEPEWVGPQSKYGKCHSAASVLRVNREIGPRCQT